MNASTTLRIFFTGLLFSLSFHSQSQTIVADVNVPNTYKTSESTLSLNGAGIREKYWIDLYVGALYLKAKSADAEKIISADENMCIKLFIISSMITSEKMTAAVDEGFTKSTKGNTAPLQQKINQFKATFNEAIKDGDIFELLYDVKSGVKIYKNGKLSATIPGLEFKKALWGIWLCNDPADEELKQKMLGR